MAVNDAAPPRFAGIGLEMTRQLLRSPWYAVFTARRPPSAATELEGLIPSGLGKLRIIRLDVTDKESIEAGRTEVFWILDGRGLDYVINNVAMAGNGF